jgi:hypothetical protein
MVPQQQKAECVLLFHESKSVTTVQNWFSNEVQEETTYEVVKQMPV